MASSTCCSSLPSGFSVGAHSFPQALGATVGASATAFDSAAVSASTTESASASSTADDIVTVDASTNAFARTTAIYSSSCRWNSSEIPLICYFCCLQEIYVNSLQRLSKIFYEMTFCQRSCLMIIVYI